MLLQCDGGTDGEAGEVAQVPVTTPSLIVTNNTFVNTVALTVMDSITQSVTDHVQYDEVIMLRVLVHAHDIKIAKCDQKCQKREIAM